MEYKVQQTYCGQYRPYGDFYREYLIKTDDEIKAVEKWALENIEGVKGKAPKSEWDNNVRYGGEKFHDADYYFKGYYYIFKVSNGYKLVACEPYTD